MLTSYNLHRALCATRRCCYCCCCRWCPLLINSKVDLLHYTAVFPHTFAHTMGWCAGVAIGRTVRTYELNDAQGERKFCRRWFGYSRVKWLLENKRRSFATNKSFSVMPFWQLFPFDARQTAHTHTLEFVELELSTFQSERGSENAFFASRHFDAFSPCVCIRGRIDCCLL